MNYRMLDVLKQHWQQFRNGQPGQRFQDRYERNRDARSQRSGWFLKPLVAVLLLLAGIVLCVIPGPGLPLLLIGLALLADVSRRVAVAMDRLELRLRGMRHAKG
jgi:hypothetical protein